MIAAQAAQDDTLQTIFSTTVKDYYAAIAARSALDAAVSTEDDARRTLQAATVRLRGGVAGVIDQLQAQTEYAQAVFVRARAAGEARVTQGVLAVDMGLPPNIPFALPAMPDDVHPEIGLDRSINELLDEARRYHPKTLEARAQLQAALSKVDDVRAQGRPSLGLNARLSNNNQPVVPSVGLAALPATGRDRFVGLQVNVPIFEGFARSYSVRAASATADQQEASLRDAEQQVTLNVWTTYVTLETSSDNLRNTEVLVDSARKSYAAAQQRYEKGVGAIIELLSAQTALSNARQRRVQSVLDWRTARLQLAASLGTLSLLALQ